MNKADGRTTNLCCVYLITLRNLLCSQSSCAYTHHLLKHPAQMMRILKSDFIGNFTHGSARACQQVLDTVDDSEVDVFNS